MLFLLFKGGTKWFPLFSLGNLNLSRIPGLALTSDRNYKTVVKSYNRTLRRCPFVSAFCDIQDRSTKCLNLCTDETRYFSKTAFVSSCRFLSPALVPKTIRHTCVLTFVGGCQSQTWKLNQRMSMKYKIEIEQRKSNISVTLSVTWRSLPVCSSCASKVSGAKRIDRL